MLYHFFCLQVTLRRFTRRITNHSCCSTNQSEGLVASALKVAAVVAYTSSGYSALRMARERPHVPIIGMTPRAAIARRLALAWGVYPVLCHEVVDVMEMSEWAGSTALREGIAVTGDSIVISAGIPFGTPGTTNLLRIMQIS